MQRKQTACTFRDGALGKDVASRANQSTEQNACACTTHAWECRQAKLKPYRSVLAMTIATFSNKVVTTSLADDMCIGLSLLMLTSVFAKAPIHFQINVHASVSCCTDEGGNRTLVYHCCLGSRENSRATCTAIFVLSHLSELLKNQLSNVAVQYNLLMQASYRQKTTLTCPSQCCNLELLLQASYCQEAFQTYHSQHCMF